MGGWVWYKNRQTLPPLPQLSDCLVQARRHVSTNRSQKYCKLICESAFYNSCQGFIDRVSECITKLFPVRAPEFPKPLRFASCLASTSLLLLLNVEHKIKRRRLDNEEPSHENSLVCIIFQRLCYTTLFLD